MKFLLRKYIEGAIFRRKPPCVCILQKKKLQRFDKCNAKRFTYFREQKIVLEILFKKNKQYILYRCIYAQLI